MATFCPYCKEEIESAIYHEWAGDSWEDKIKCPMCGKEVEIDVAQEPIFLAHKKDRRISQ